MGGGAAVAVVRSDQIASGCQREGRWGVGCGFEWLCVGLYAHCMYGFGGGQVSCGCALSWAFFQLLRLGFQLWGYLRIA